MGNSSHSSKQKYLTEAAASRCFTSEVAGELELRKRCMHIPSCRLAFGHKQFGNLAVRTENDSVSAVRTNYELCIWSV